MHSFRQPEVQVRMDPVEMMVVMDGEFTKKEIKQIMRKVKRKLTSQPDQRESSSSVAENTESETPKKKRKKTEDTQTPEEKSRSKLKTDKSKLNSRLRRILKSKEKVNSRSSRTQGKSFTELSSHVDSDEIGSGSEQSGNDSTTSDYSTNTSDSGVSLHLDEELNSRIVAMDCEFVGVGNPQRSALGRVSVLDYSGL